MMVRNTEKGERLGGEVRFTNEREIVPGLFGGYGKSRVAEG
jgi:hypothetical protein